MNYLINSINYIFYRISLYYENTGIILGYGDDGHSGGSNLTAFLLACNFETIIIIIHTFRMVKVPLYDLYIDCFVYMVFYFFYFSGKKYQALKEKYKNENNKTKKGYAVLAYMIMSFVLFITLLIINSLIVA